MCVCPQNNKRTSKTNFTHVTKCVISISNISRFFSGSLQISEWISLSRKSRLSDSMTQQQHKVTSNNLQQYNMIPQDTIPQEAYSTMTQETIQYRRIQYDTTCYHTITQETVQCDGRQYSDSPTVNQGGRPTLSTELRTLPTEMSQLRDALAKKQCF